MVKIKIVRHSERLDFAYPFYWMFCFGELWDDPPLTSNGKLIARKQASILINSNFFPKRIYSSPYCRTIETAEQIKNVFDNIEIVEVPLLAEYQPKRCHYIKKYPLGVPTMIANEKTKYIYPETYKDYMDRIKFIVYKIAEIGEDAIIITHGAALEVWINYLLELYPDVNIEPVTSEMSYYFFNKSSINYMAHLTFDFDVDEKRIIKSSILFYNTNYY